MGAPLRLGGPQLRLEDVVEVADQGRRVTIAPRARREMERSAAWVRAMGEQSETPIYGVTTGFGSLADQVIPAEDRAQLSLNLLRSHAAGVGPDLPERVVRAMMLLRAATLSRGVSGCQPAIVALLVASLNAGIHPVVRSQGSCGSSGDLAPLSQLSLALVEGEPAEVIYGGRRCSAAEAYAAAGLQRISVGAKDGLALTNGAQLTTAIAALASAEARQLILWAELAAAASIEALRGFTRAYHPAVHAMRPYPGAQATALNLRRLLQGSALVDDPTRRKMQSAYSLRCAPTVIGAARDMVAFASRQVEVELNSVTDNPLILLDAGPMPEGFRHDEQNRAWSAGLFHGEPVGMAMDALKIAIAEVANLSERRLYRLTTAHLSEQLPPELAGASLLGMMSPQTTAAALVSENKALGWPASMDSIPTCEDQEDHVAMSTTAARRAARVVDNCRRVIAIEALAAAQALELRAQRGLEPGVGGCALRDALRQGGMLAPELLPSEAIAAVEGLLRGPLPAGLPALVGVGAPLPREARP